MALERLIALVGAVALGGIGLLLFGLPSQAQTTASVTLAWNPSLSSGIAGYRLHYGTSSGTHPNILNVGNTTTATVSSLTVGHRYYFVATAYNTAGLESPPSNEVSVSFPANLPPGTNHQRIAKDFNGDGYADLVWENTTTGQRVIWLLKNGVHSSSINLPTVSPAWHIVDH